MNALSFVVGFMAAGVVFIAVLYLQERAGRRRFLHEIDELLRRNRALPPAERADIAILSERTAQLFRRPGVRH